MVSSGWIFLARATAGMSVGDASAIGFGGPWLLGLPRELLLGVLLVAAVALVAMLFSLRMYRRTRRRTRMLQVLSRCSHAVLRARDEASLLREACNIVVARTGYLFAWVGMARDDEARTVEPVARAGREEGYLEAVRVSWADDEHGRGPTGRAIRTGRPAVVRDLRTEPSTGPWRAEALRRGYRSSIALPLVGQEGVLGALNVYAQERDAFDEEELALLEELAADLAYGVESLRARAAVRAADEALREREALEREFSQRLAALHGLREQLSRAASVDEICRLAVELGRERLGFDRLGIWLVDEEDPSLVRGTYGTDESGRLRDERAARRPGVADERLREDVFVRGGYVVYRDCELWDHAGNVVGKGTRVVAAIWDGHEVIGYLSADNLLRGQPITERQERLLSLYATSVGHLVSRKRSEEALRQSRERLRAIFDASDELIFTKDRDSVYRDANAAFAELIGVPVEQIVGKKDSDFFAPAEAEALRAADRQVFETGRMWRGEYVLHIRGQPHTFHTVKVPLRGPDGRVSEICGFAEDVTDRRRMERELQQRREQLDRAARLEAIGKLAGGIAHDFNNIMTGVMGYCHFLLSAMAKDDPRRGDVEEILAGGRRAASLTQKLLAFGRQQMLEPKVLDLNDVVAGMEEMLRRLIGEDIELSVIAAPDLGSVRADPGQIEQVIMNLAVNARDAMPDGGSLIIETANAELDDEYARTHAGVQPGPYVMLAVTDTGCGMDAQTREHAFDPFFTTKGPGEGTGLGLATVHGIVNQHGGHIWLYSEQGRGTTFKIYLPRVMEEPETEHVPVGPQKTVRGGTETILLVEDDEAVRRLAERILTSRGYRVLPARTPYEAQDVMARQGRDAALLLTDVVLPDVNGAELYRKLAADWPSLKVLYISGYTSNAIANRGVLKPGTPFLAKPFGPQELLTAVRRVLDADA